MSKLEVRVLGIRAEGKPGIVAGVLVALFLVLGLVVMTQALAGRGTHVDAKVDVKANIGAPR